MKIAFFLCFLISAPLAWSASKDAAAPFTLAIIPSRSSPEAKAITLQNGNTVDFCVVLTNTSPSVALRMEPKSWLQRISPLGAPSRFRLPQHRDSQPVFEHWNSWGYQNVSFEFTTAVGTKAVFSKRPQIFTMNVPSTFLIPPGGHQVYAIRLNESWESRPMLAADAETAITVKAIYEVTVTPESTRQKVWAGRVESKPYSFILRQ